MPEANDDDGYYDRCFLCGRSVQLGPHKYDGKILQMYGKLLVCMSCYESNWDGWTPRDEQKIVAYCEEHGIPVPPSNNKGFLPRGD